MLESKKSVFQGTLKNKSLNEVQEYIWINIVNNIKSFDCALPKEECDYGYWINRHLFGPERFIHINSKNIEYTSTFHLTDIILDSKTCEEMKRLKIADVLISFVVYRIGQYSYFSADCQALLPTE